MLAASDRGIPAGTRTRLIVEPARPVSLSVLPLEDPVRAQEVSLESGIPEAVLRNHDAVVRQTHRRAGVVVLDVPEGRQAGLRRELEAAGFIARPPKPVYALLNESVPLLQVQPVWKSGIEGDGIRVGIVDTGADHHPDFGDRIVSYRDFTESGTPDEVGHGTHVAGIIAGAGAVYRGVAPRASLVIAKALSLHGGTEDTVLAALSWLSRQKVDVANLSLGGSGDPHDPLSREVDALSAEGILVCVAAGNSGPAAGTIGSPGCAAGAITVGAIDKRRRITEYSSRGPVAGLSAHKPDLVAVGGGTTPTAACRYGTGVASARAQALDADRCTVSSRYVRMSGTSMAAPHVAGVCALLLEASRSMSRSESRIARARAVRRALTQTADDLGLAPDVAGAGGVDAAKALTALGSRRSAAVPTMSSSSPAIARSGIEPK
ncbi:MAG TPA: S8 family serine peptidase [Candidatus Bathyarchaeia archaeon]|nr:S8 family serine peptidase [Candidatus Bathyarchaeia archaeon]